MAVTVCKILMEHVQDTASIEAAMQKENFGADDIIAIVAKTEVGTAAPGLPEPGPALPPPGPALPPPAQPPQAAPSFPPPRPEHMEGDGSDGA